MTAFKTVSMRMRGMSKEGERISGLMPMLEQMFQDVGLTLKEDNETFKSTYQIFNELAEIWDTLSDMEQAQFVEAIAGKRQGNIITAMLDNWEDAEKSLETGLDSAGSAMKEFENYQESIEYRMQRFRSTVIEFWQETLDTQAIKDFISAGTSLVELLTKLSKTIGIIPPAISLLTMGFMGANKTLRETATRGGEKVLGFFNKVPEKAGVATTATYSFSSAVQGLRASLTALGATLKSIASFAIGTLFPVAVITAFTYAIQKLISKIKEYKEEQKKVKEYNDELVESYSNNKKEIDKLVQRYEALDKKVQNNEISKNNEEYQKVQNELNELLPQVTKRVDNQGNAHLRNTEAVKEEIDYVKSLIEERKKLSVAEFDDNLKNQVKNIKELNKEIENLSGSKRDLEVGDEDTYPTITPAESEEDYIKRQIKLREKQYELDQAIGETRKQVKDYIKDQLELNGVIDDLTDSSEEYIDSMVKTEMTAENLRKNGIDKVKEDIDSKAFAIKEAEESLKKLSESETQGVGSTIEYSNTIRELKDTFKDLGISKKLLNELIDKYIQKTDEANNNSKDFNTILNDSIGVIEDYNEKTNKLVDAYKKLSEGQSLSNEEILELINNYPSLRNALIEQNGQLSLNKKAIRELLEEEKITHRERISIQEEELIARRDRLNKILDNFESEIIGITTLKKEYKDLHKEISGLTPQAMGEEGIKNIIKEEVKGTNENLKVIEKLRNSIGSNFENLGDSASSAGDDFSETFDLSEEKLKNVNHEIKILEEKISNVQDIEEKEKFYDQLVESYKQKGEILKDIINWQEKQLSDVEQKLKQRLTDEEFKKLKEGAIESLNITNEKTAELMNTFQDLKQKIRENNLEISEIDNSVEDAKESVLDLYQDIIDERKDIADEVVDVQKKAYEEIKEAEIKEIEEQIEKENERNENRIDNLENELEEFEKKAEKEKEKLELQLEEEEDRHDKVMDNLDKELDRHDEIIDARLRMLDRQEEDEESEDELKKLLEDRKGIQDEINRLSLDDSLEARSKLEELREELNEKEKEIEEHRSDRERDLRRRNLEDQRRNFKKEIEEKRGAEERKYEQTKERIEEEIEDWDNQIEEHEEYTDIMIKNENKRNENKIENLEKEKEKTEQHYNDIINNERKWTEIRNNIVKGHTDEIKNNFDTLTNKLKGNMEFIGKVITQNLIDKLSKAKKGLNDINTGLPSDINYNDDYEIDKDETNDKNESDYSQYKDQINEIIYAKEKHDKAIKENNEGMIKWAKQYSEKYYEQLPNDLAEKLKKMDAASARSFYKSRVMHDGGIVGNGSKTIEFIDKLFKTKPNEVLTKLEKGELVASEKNALNNFIPNLKSIIGNVSKNGNKNIKNEFKFIIENMNGNKEDADYVVNRVVDGVKKKGGIT